MKTTTTSSSLLALLAASHATAAIVPVVAIAARQTDDAVAPTGCAATAEAILSAAPTPGKNLIGYVVSAMGHSDADATATMPPCAITSPPQKYASAYAEYTTSLSSWSSAQYDAAQSFALSGTCKDSGPASEVVVLLDAVDFLLDKACSTGAGASASAGTATTTAVSSSGAPTGAGSSPTPAGSVSSSTQPAAGAHVTHAPLAALAAAGVVAAAAML